MFYTGTSREDGGNIQRVGAAISEDLITWTKLDSNPLVEADPAFYELYSPEIWHDQAWRDPWIFRHEDEFWHMLVTARSDHGDPKTRGVIGHARSRNLRDWHVLKPLSVPGKDFGQLEVFQYEIVDGVPIVVFCCGWRELSAERQERQGKIDYTYSIAGDPLCENLDFSNAAPFVDLPVYAGRLVHHPSTGWNLIGFWNDVDGSFQGYLSDPMPVTASKELGLIPRI
jgi:beta-fructofuranosidase